MSATDDKRELAALQGLAGALVQQLDHFMGRMRQVEKRLGISNDFTRLDLIGKRDNRDGPNLQKHLVVLVQALQSHHRRLAALESGRGDGTSKVVKLSPLEAAASRRHLQQNINKRIV